MVVSVSSDLAAEQAFEAGLAVRVAQNIAARRRTLGLTQAQLAERMGIETETLSRFERGKHLPKLAKLARLAALLQTTLADLLAEDIRRPDDEALAVTAWLSPLSPTDRAYAIGQLKQCCDHLAARHGGTKQPAASTSPGQTISVDEVRKALSCPVGELEQNIDNVLALLACGLTVTVTKGREVCRVNAGNAYLLYRLVPAVQAKVLAQYPDREAFWTSQPVLKSYWESSPERAMPQSVVKKKDAAATDEAKHAGPHQKKGSDAGSEVLKATVEHVPDDEATSAGEDA